MFLGEHSVSMNENVDSDNAKFRVIKERPFLSPTVTDTFSVKEGLV